MFRGVRPRATTALARGASSAASATFTVDADQDALAAYASAEDVLRHLDTYTPEPSRRALHGRVFFDSGEGDVKCIECRARDCAPYCAHCVDIV